MYAGEKDACYLDRVRYKDEDYFTRVYNSSLILGFRSLERYLAFHWKTLRVTDEAQSSVQCNLTFFPAVSIRLHIPRDLSLNRQFLAPDPFLSGSFLLERRKLDAAKEGRWSPQTRVPAMFPAIMGRRIEIVTSGTVLISIIKLSWAPAQISKFQSGNNTLSCVVGI